ncbi:HPr family phosphocarrier protein [uncultured Bifidobacterium sp.]|uniref:HPr family phosphocarrier protein n=1 Tax=uncultured Bifidobacterium sp. TaxID=165187 RepID=UPI00262DB855|nr:HPr family phosphocarrier protein [uncultured Bifidobacterium sp.]
MSTATRTTTITDPVGIHARPAAEFSQAVAASGCSVTISKEPGTPGVNASSILSIMGLGVKGGDTVEIIVNGADSDAVADSLIATLTKGE